MKYRRFGRTELQIPVISCGGMRYQETWNDEESASEESQVNLENCIRRALELGINHIETARGYGSSEYQLGHILPKLPREELIVQTKVGPTDEVQPFIDNFERSMKLLKLDYVDLFAFHGVNSQIEYERTLKCLDTALKCKEEGRVRNVGFSTHGNTQTIIDTINLGCLDYVNLHWYYIFQDNWPAILEAQKQDMGVFIISPNDKGGLLYQPSRKLMEICHPLHPLVFNGLFCLSHLEVHTLSCGAAKPEDFDIHMETVEKLEQASVLIPPIIERLENTLAETLGVEWANTWHVGLPEWKDTPSEINIPMILRLRNLALAYDMVEYGKMRYNLLGNGGSWFPGQKAEKLDTLDLSACLAHSPHADKIPGYLAEAHQLLVGEEKKRLQES